MQKRKILPTTLAIDTSCDETSVSVVQGLTVLSNVLPSQMEYHRKYGGVVPTLAKLAHQERIDNVVSESMQRAHVDFDVIDFIAVTIGPGLAMALEVGIKKAKELAAEYDKPLIVVNHMEGHLLSAFAERRYLTPSTSTIIGEGGRRPGEVPGVPFPTLGFLISGGHTELILVRDFLDYEKIGETLDDSCGEAYDKCGRMMGLGYPAGPVISEFAKRHRKNIRLKFFRKNQGYFIEGINKFSKVKYELPVAMLNSNDLNFSYSGLKTAVKYLINDLIGRELTREDELRNQIDGLTEEQIYDLCVVFEAAALAQLSKKLEKALRIYPDTKEVWLGGGVVASARLRSTIRSAISSRDKAKITSTMRYPYSNKLTGDNAAMIGIAANTKIMKIGGLQAVKDRINSNKNSLENYGIFKNNFDKIDRKPNLSL